MNSGCFYSALFMLPGPCHPPARLKKESSDEEPMQTDIGESSYVPRPDENPLYTAEPLTLDDLKLLSDLFYLPYEHGPTARTMLQELDWLKNHSQPATSESDQVTLCSSTFSNADNFTACVPLSRCCMTCLSLLRLQSGAPGRSSSMTCARQWCRCSIVCQTLRTGAFCTTSTTTSVTSRVGSVWLEPTWKHSVRFWSLGWEITAKKPFTPTVFALTTLVSEICAQLH